MLDLCTGNGSLAVLAALAWPDVQVTAADLSADALAVAQRNVERHGLQQRISLAQGDGWHAVPVAQAGRFDLVLCNPPYVNAQSMAALPAEFRAEPALALAGGSDGMDFIRGLLLEAVEHLTAAGILVLEIGHEREHFEAAFPRLNPVWLSTSAGDDHVLLLDRAALRRLAGPPAAAHQNTEPGPRMINLKNLTLRRGVKVVLNNASVTLNPGEKVGLIGRNGAGKSSLFALLTHKLQADAGDVEDSAALACRRSGAGHAGKP